jgi:23S rRNA maturation mini-RNase III
MSEYKFDRRNYQKSLDKIYQDVVDEKTKMQNQYDRETNHSINREEQARWLKKIAELLEEYEDYDDY